MVYVLLVAMEYTHKLYVALMVYFLTVGIHV